MLLCWKYCTRSNTDWVCLYHTQDMVLWVVLHTGEREVWGRGAIGIGRREGRGSSYRVGRWLTHRQLNFCCYGCGCFFNQSLLGGIHTHSVCIYGIESNPQVLWYIVTSTALAVYCLVQLLLHTAAGAGSWLSLSGVACSILSLCYRWHRRQQSKQHDNEISLHYH